MENVCAYCWASGLVEIGKTCPKGALPLVTGPKKAVKEAVEVLSSHAYDGKSFLVPKGIGWINGDMASALEDVRRFANLLESRVARQEG